MLVSALKRAEIKRIQQELGITILVTHDQVEAVTMADQAADEERRNPAVQLGRPAAQTGQHVCGILYG